MESDMILFSGNANKELASKICQHLDIELGHARVDRFSLFPAELCGPNLVFIREVGLLPGVDSLADLFRRPRFFIRLEDERRPEFCFGQQFARRDGGWVRRVPGNGDRDESTATDRFVVLSREPTDKAARRTRLTDVSARERRLVLRGGLFFLDVFVDQTRHAAAAKTAGRFVPGLAIGVAHETFVEGFLRAHEIVVVEGQLAAFAAL